MKAVELLSGTGHPGKAVEPCLENAQLSGCANDLPRWLQCDWHLKDEAPWSCAESPHSMVARELNCKWFWS